MADFDRSDATVRTRQPLVAGAALVSFIVSLLGYAVLYSCGPSFRTVGFTVCVGAGGLLLKAWTGTSGQLVLERKRGASNFFETRVASWSPREIETTSREELLSAYRELLVDAWETWEGVDGSHTAEDLDVLKAALFTGLDLGLDVDDLLTITDYPLDAAQPHYVHDIRAYSPLPASIDRRVRLTRHLPVPEALRMMKVPSRNRDVAILLGVPLVGALLIVGTIVWMLRNN